MDKWKVKKVKFSDLLKTEGTANADFYRDEPEKRKHHVRHRASRNRLISPKGSEYTKSLSSNPVKDIKLNEVAREFINNGFKQTKAYASVFGISLRSAAWHASQLFASTWFRAKVSLMLLGVDGDVGLVPKEYFIQKMMNVLEMNILDYLDDDGLWLTVPQLRELPLEMQVMLDNLKMTNIERDVVLRDDDNKIVYDEAGKPCILKIREQRVFIKLPDKYDYLKMLAQSMEWLVTHIDVQLALITRETMQEAEARIHQYRRDSIEGEAKEITAD